MEKPFTGVMKKYRDVVVSLREDFSFLATLEGQERVFQSYSDAVTAIDEHHKRKEAMERKRVSLAAIECDGRKVTITGIHARTGDVLTTPKAGEYGTLYPEHPWVESKIKRILALEAEVRLLKQSLKPCIIPKPSRSYGGFASIQHAALVDKLADDYDHALTAAKKADTSKELK